MTLTLPKAVATEEQVEIVLQMYDLGVAQAVIQEELQLRPMLIYDILTANGRRAFKPNVTRNRRRLEQRQQTNDAESPLVSLEYISELDEVIDEVRELTTETIDAAVASYVRGDATMMDICLTHQMSVKALYALLHERKVPLRDGTGITVRQQKLDLAIQMYKDEATYYEIREVTGVSSFSINQELHRRKVPLRKNR